MVSIFFSDYLVGVFFLLFIVFFGMCFFYDSRLYFSFFYFVLNLFVLLLLLLKKWLVRILIFVFLWLWNVGFCLFGISMGLNVEKVLSIGRDDLNFLLMFFIRVLMYFWRSFCRFLKLFLV